MPLSAEHGEGLGELYERCAVRRRQRRNEAGAGAEDEATKPLQLAIVGRPNVGKSTLVNRLIGEDRLLTGPEAGITRDAIAVDWDLARPADPPGRHRRDAPPGARSRSRLEQLSVADTLRAIRFAETVVLVLDALQPLERQDLTIADLVAEEGRALVLAVNKWDSVRDREPRR